MITRLRPHLIFSGHDHKSVHFVGDLNTGETIYVEVFKDSVKYDRLPKWRFQSSKSHTNEILVPTCSYRMGVQNIGYGLAVIGWYNFDLNFPNYVIMLIYIDHK